MRAPILALLLLALASSRQALAAETSDTIEGMQKNCLSATSTPPAAAAGADNAQCQACVSDIGNLDGLASQRMFACYSVCQNATFLPVGSPTTGADCIDCISNTAYSVQACKDCMSSKVTAAGGTSKCFSCLDADPWAGETLSAAQQYKRDSYFAACAQCATIPGATFRNQCVTCISTKNATLQGAPTFGILTYAELTSPGFPAAGRDNDFGACVYLANQSYLISIGSVSVSGQYANCVPKAGDPPIAIPIDTCISCMSYVNQQQAVISPSTPLKSYGCADICQNYDYYPIGSTPAQVTALGTQCVNCLKNPSLTQAWACGNCMKTLVPTDCFNCIVTDPYGGNTSNYNWACGMCATINNANLRSLCFQCIRSQPGSGPENTTEITEANICSCIDLIQNSSISVSRPLTAMERSCYEPFTKRDSNGNLLPSPAIPWGANTIVNTSDCVLCMRDASVGITLPGLNKAYACREYCQDPDLVANAGQGSDCATCVKSPNVHDPSACKTCMAATSNDINRRRCFTCVTSPAPNFASNHAWGCGQCAQLPTSVQSFCFLLMQQDILEPCEIIDGIKNGTLLNAPGSSLCGITAPNMVGDSCFQGCGTAPGAPENPTGPGCGWTRTVDGSFSGFFPFGSIPPPQWIPLLAPGYMARYNLTGSAAVTGCNYAYVGGAGNGSFEAWAQRILGISYGVTYEVTFWFNAAGDVPSRLSVQVDNIVIINDSNPTTTGNWVQRSFTFVGAFNDPDIVLTFGVSDDPAFMLLTAFTIKPLCT